MELTQDKIDVLGKSVRRQLLKLEIMEENYKVIDTIEGYAVGGSISADATNDIRRSGNISMTIPINPYTTALLDALNGYVVDVNGKIWLDKRVKIYVGFENFNNQEMQTTWYKMGVFLISQPQRTFSGTEYLLSFQCVDLMILLTGERKGQLGSITTMIPQGEYTTNEDNEVIYKETSRAEAIINVLTELGGITKYSLYPIPEIYQYLSRDIQVGIGATVYDLLKELLSDLPTWQMYFDLDGVLIISPIPSGASGMVYPLNESQRLSDVMAVNFSNVKNQIIVYGRANSMSYFTSGSANVLYSDIGGTSYSKLVLTYSSIDTDNITIKGTTFGFLSLPTYNSKPITEVEIWDANTSSMVFSAELTKFEGVNSAFGVDYNNNHIESEMIPLDEICFLRISDCTITENASGLKVVDLTQPITCEFMGKQQVSYTLVNDNKESPYYINNGIKETNYYAGEAKLPSGYNLGESYLLTLNNDTTFGGLNNGDIITFIANAPNKHASGVAYTSLSVRDFSLNNVVTNIPLCQNKWNNDNLTRPYVDEDKIRNDYTIWEVKYENINNEERFVLLGMAKNALTLVLSGGEYDNIYADQLAYERCVYELFTHSTLNYTITLTQVPDYLIDVNWKIYYNPNNATPLNVTDYEEYLTMNENVQGEYEQFITLNGEIFYVRADTSQFFMTKQVTYPLGIGETQQITASRVYDSGNLLGDY